MVEVPEFYVMWDIDLTADSPEEAARLALEIQRDPTSTATTFEVTESTEYGWSHTPQEIIVTDERKEGNHG